MENCPQVETAVVMARDMGTDMVMAKVTARTRLKSNLQKYNRCIYKDICTFAFVNSASKSMLRRGRRFCLQDEGQLTGQRPIRENIDVERVTLTVQESTMAHGGDHRRIIGA